MRRRRTAAVRPRRETAGATGENEPVGFPGGGPSRVGGPEARFAKEVREKKWRYSGGPRWVVRVGRLGSFMGRSGSEENVFGVVSLPDLIKGSRGRWFGPVSFAKLSSQGRFRSAVFEQLSCESVPFYRRGVDSRKRTSAPVRGGVHLAPRDSNRLSTAQPTRPYTPHSVGSSFFLVYFRPKHLLIE